MLHGEARHKQLSVVIGHRGAPRLCPENSLAGFERAAAAGLRWVELDVQASRDGHAFVYHDYEVREAGGQLLSSMDATALRAVKLDEQGTPIPALAEVLALAQRLKLGLVLEIKSRDGREQDDAEALLRALEANAPAEGVIASFQPQALELVHQAQPSWPLALNAMRLPARAPELVGNIHFDARAADRRMLQRLRAEGYGLYSFTVNDAPQARELFAMGVHGVFSDEPGLLRELEQA